ncbi:unnamed protein product [Auanema sp. JU1783]|nr:unnamed protein product [Auanema sp. JU1783]
MTHAATSLIGKEIETYVFLDFETKGLSKTKSLSDSAIDQLDLNVSFGAAWIAKENENVKQPRVTEIGMVAVKRSDFQEAVRKSENKEQLDDIIVGSFQRHVNPELTGDELEKFLRKIKQKPTVPLKCFGEEWPAIKKFLDGLTKPLCIVAHNGSRFDFPILREELKIAKIDVQKSLGGYYFADSLYAFRSIDRDYLERIREIMGFTNSTNNKNKKKKKDDAHSDLNINDWPLAIKARFKSSIERKDNGDWSFNEKSYKKLKFKLLPLYKAIFGGRFTAHKAVNDCKALLKLCWAFNTVDYFEKESAKIFKKKKE